jgi:hypothetical protein
MEQREKEIAEYAAQFVTNSEELNNAAGGDLDALQLCITGFKLGAKWADENPENAFSKPSARDFYNSVCLMRMNQRNFFALARKKELTDEERANKQQFLQNSAYFEGIVDSVIEKTQKAIERAEGAQQ